MIGVLGFEITVRRYPHISRQAYRRIAEQVLELVIASIGNFQRSGLA